MKDFIVFIAFIVLAALLFILILGFRTKANEMNNKTNTVLDGITNNISRSVDDFVA